MQPSNNALEQMKATPHYIKVSVTAPKPGSTLVSHPYPRPRNKGTAGVTSRPSAKWIAYGAHNKVQKKRFTARAAELRVKLRQIVRVWHAYTEGIRLTRQKHMADIMMTSMTSGFTAATQKLAATRLGAMRRKARRTLLDSKRMARETFYASKINKACRRFLDWLHAQPWHGLTGDAVNPVTMTHQVRVKAKRAAAERIVGNYLIKWAHDAREVKGRATVNRVQRRMAAGKIRNLFVTTRKRRRYQYRVMARIQAKFSRLAAEAKARLGARREHWRECFLEIHEYPDKVRAYRERFAALKIQKNYRGMVGRAIADNVYVKARLLGVRKIISVAHIEQAFRLYQRRKVLRIRQHRADERATMKLRMGKKKGKRTALGATALKRFRRVKVPGRVSWKKFTAARRIQRWIKGTLMARQLAWTVRRIMWSNNIVKQFHEAATKIQRLIIYRERRRQMTATKFQAIYRGWHYRMSVIQKRRDAQRQAALLAREAKASAISAFKMRVTTGRNLMLLWCTTKLLVRLWRAQWAVHYRKEAEKALLKKMHEDATKIQRFVFGVKEKRIARLIVVNMLRKKFAREAKRSLNAVALPGVKLKPLKLGDKVTVRWMGGAREYPAIIRNINIEDAPAMAPKKRGPSYTFSVRYADGTTEHKVPRKWIKFVQRPRFLPLYGDDEDFLQAPVEGALPSVNKWADTVKEVIAKKKLRDVELKAAEAVGVDGDKPVEAEGVVDVRVVVGEVENQRMEEQQNTNFRRGRPRYTKLVPDLRESIRLGRRDFESVYVWYLRSRKGPFVTDLRLVRTAWLAEPMTPYMQSLRTAGFSVLFRPNKVAADLFPLPAPTEYRVDVAMVASVGDGLTAPRLASIMMSSRAPGATGLSGNVLSEMDLFNDGYSPLPEDLGIFKLDPGIRCWLKWNIKNEIANVGTDRRRKPGVDPYALKHAVPGVDMSHALPTGKKLVSKQRAKKEKVNRPPTPEESPKKKAEVAAEKARLAALREKSGVALFSPVAGDGGGAAPTLPPSPVKTLRPSASEAQLLRPMQGTPLHKNPSASNPMFARRGLGNLADGDVVRLARAAALGDKHGEAAPTAATRIWPVAVNTVTKLPDAAPPKLVPLSAFDKKLNRPEASIELPRLGSYGGTPSPAGSLLSPMRSVPSPGAPPPGLLSDVDGVVPSEEYHGSPLRPRLDPRKHHPAPPPDDRRTYFPSALPTADDRLAIGDPSILDVDLFDADPSALDRVKHTVEDFVKKVRTRVGELSYQYLPPSFDDVDEYDSEDEGVATEKKKQGLAKLVGALQALKKALAKRVLAYKEETAQWDRPADASGTESDFSDWREASDLGMSSDSSEERQKARRRRRRRKSRKSVASDGGSSVASRATSHAASTVRGLLRGLGSVVGKISKQVDRLATARSKKKSSRGGTARSGLETGRITGRTLAEEAAAELEAAAAEERKGEEGEEGGGAAAGAGGEGEGEEEEGEEGWGAAVHPSPAPEEGYYDDYGNWVAEAAQVADVPSTPGYYNEAGEWVDSGAWVDDGGQASGEGWSSPDGGTVPAAGYYDEEGEWVEGGGAGDDTLVPAGYYDEDGEWVDADGVAAGYVGEDGEWVDGGDVPTGYYGEDGEWVEPGAEGGVVAAAGAPSPSAGKGIYALESNQTTDYGGGLKRTAEDTRTEDERRIDQQDADIDRRLKIYSVKPTVAAQREKARGWIEAAERRAADPFYRPVRMATAPKDRIEAAVLAEMAREEAAKATSRKAQYFEKVELRDQVFPFKDEYGMETVEMVGEFTPPLRLLALDTDQLLALRDIFRQMKPKRSLGVSVHDLVRAGGGEFNEEPLSDAWFGVVGQPGNVRLGFKLWLEFMVRFCCTPKQRLLRSVFRSFDSSGIGHFQIIDMARMIKTMHPRFSKGMLGNMLSVCLNTCKMSKSHKKQYCTFTEFQLLPRSSTSLFYPLFVWFDEFRALHMGTKFWTDAYDRLTRMDASMLTITVPNETVKLLEDGTPVTKPKGDIKARKRKQIKDSKMRRQEAAEVAAAKKGKRAKPMGKTKD